MQRVPGAIRTNWFGAASLVTGRSAIGAADFINGTVLSKDDEAYILHIHQELAKKNFENYKKLLKGELPDGIEIPADAEDPVKALDYALVEWEQEQVTELTEKYFADNPKLDQAAIMESISRATDPESGIGIARSILARGAGPLPGLVDETFTEKPYNFASEEDRIALGRAAVDHVRAERENGVGLPRFDRRCRTGRDSAGLGRPRRPAE